MCRRPSILIAVVFAALAPFFVISCTLKHAPIPSGTIPKLENFNPRAQQFGKKLFKDLCDDYELMPGHQQHDRLTQVFDHLKQAAGVDHVPWHIYLFHDPDIVNIRAVHGNYIFVWSGIFDVVDSEDEIAGLLAGEMAHVLAYHTAPVQFNVWSDIFFNTAELATSIAVMTLSQGVIAVSGSGWMKWIYVEAADLDPLDRIYSPTDEQEAAEIAVLIISKSKYSPEAILRFWRRVMENEDLQRKAKELERKLSPSERVAMLEEILQTPPQQNKLTFK